MKYTSRVIAFAVALLAFALPVQGQQVFMDHGVRQSITAATSTRSQRVTLTWGSATDGRFSADTYHVELRLVNADTQWTGVRKQIITTLTVNVPLKLNVDDSVGLYVKVRASRRGVLGADSVTGMRWYKRRMTTSERAHVDSFPDANHRGVLCSFYGQKMDNAWIAIALAKNLSELTTAVDSAKERNYWEAVRVGPDSVYTPQDCGAKWCLRKGYAYPIAMLVKNRYTGKVGYDSEPLVWTSTNVGIVSITPGNVDCAKKIAEWEAERSS